MSERAGSVRLHLPTGAGTLSEEALGRIRSAYDSAVGLAEVALGLTALDVAVLDAPGEAIPDWGVGGYTFGAHSVVVALDPAVELDEDRLLATLVHEFHHVMRWRGPGCGSSLGERVVSEGLAMLFEEEVLGRPSEFALQAVSAEHERLALTHLGDDPADEARWFFGGEALPRWLGYSLGYRWARAYCQERGTSAADQVATPAEDLYPQR